MKTKIQVVFILIVLFESTSYGQVGCERMMGDAEIAFQEGQYRSAILKYNAAKYCNPALSAKADEEMLKIFDKIEGLRDEANNERESAQKNLTKLSKLLSDITDLIYYEDKSNIIGFDPLSQDLFELLDPYFGFIESSSATERRPWSSARANILRANSYERLGNTKLYEEFMEKAYYQCLEQCEYLSNNNNIPKELSITLLESALYYSWSLMDKRQIENAQNVLDDVTQYIPEDFQSAQADLLIAISRYNNSYSRLMIIKDQFKESYDYQRSAVELAHSALKQDSLNLIHKRTYAVYLDNLGNSSRYPLSQLQRDSLAQLSYLLLKEVRETPGSGVGGLTSYLQGLYDQSLDLEPEKQVQLLDSANSIIENYLFLDPNLSSRLLLHRMRNNARIIDLIDDKEEEKKIIESIISDWEGTLSGKQVLPKQWLLRNVYDRLKGFVYVLYDENTELLTALNRISASLEFSLKEYGDIPEMAYIAANSYLAIAEYTRKSANYSYDEVNLALAKSISFFEKTNILESLEFNEKHADYCRALSQRIQLNYERGHIDAMLTDQTHMNNLFNPILEKNPFDFYLRQHFWGSNMRIGDLLFKLKRYDEAESYLEYATKWGVKESALHLAKIYRNGYTGNVNASLADSLESAAGKMSMQKFTIPCDFGGVTAPFEVYVKVYPKGFSYRGIDDQAEWLLQARGGVVPQDVIDSFRKLQDLAEKNNVSFPDLCAYALEAANKKEDDLSGDTYQKVQSYLEDEKYDSRKELDILFKNFDRDDIVYVTSYLTKRLKNVDTKNEVDILKFDQLLQGLATKIQSNGLDSSSVQLLYSIAKVYRDRSSNLNSILRELEFPSKALMTYQFLSKISEDKKILEKIASDNEGYAYSLIKQGYFELGLETAKLALQINSNQNYAKANLPLGYLLTDDFKNAKKYYLEYKDQEFVSQYSTYKDAFLADFADLEENGIYHPDFDRIKKLLDDQ